MRAAQIFKMYEVGIAGFPTNIPAQNCGEGCNNKDKKEKYNPVEKLS